MAEGDDKDQAVLIPHRLERDARFRIRGDASSGIGNLRMRVTLETPGLVLDLNGAEVAKRIAVMVRENLSRKFAKGQDAQGRALPAIKGSTIERRIRRTTESAVRTIHHEGRLGRALNKAQAAGDAKKIQSLTKRLASGGLEQRFRLRGRSYGHGGPYHPHAGTTPLNESGLFADNVAVEHKGKNSGDPTFLISLPSGGKNRGLVNDDGRGARQFAAKHYGFERLLAFPHDLDAAIDKELEMHLADVLESGLGVLRTISRVVRQIDRAIAEANEDNE